MREIKFRMWDLENKVMIDGDSLAFEEYAPISHLLTQKGIMQYTGLKDDRGKPIYEGDVVEHVLARWLGEVRFADGSYIVQGRNGKWDLSVPRAERLEVIGNIYEHPHLLETPKAIESTV